MFTKFLSSFCTAMIIPTLKYLAKCIGLKSIFACIMQPQSVLNWFVGLAFWLRPADAIHCSCSSSLLAAYKLNETGKLLTS